MSYTSYQQDVFVSYGHLDNPSEDEKGWIDRFHQDLGWRISQLLVSLNLFWRDNSPDGAVNVQDELTE